MSRGRPLGMMFHGVVVYVPASGDSCICTVNVICLTNTWKGQRTEESCVYGLYLPQQIQSNLHFA